MKYLKYFESDITWDKAVEFSQKRLIEKLESINNFGRYIGNFHSSRMSGNLTLAQIDSLKETDILTTNDLKQFWLIRLREIFGIKLGTMWVSNHTLERFIREYPYLADNRPEVVKFRNGRTQEKIQKSIDKLYEISLSDRHDISNIKLLKELLFILQDDDMISDIKIQMTYFENLRKDGKLVPIFLISYSKNRASNPFDFMEKSDVWQSKYDRLLNQFKKKLPYYGLEFLNNKDGIIKIAQTGNIRELPELS